MRLELDEAVELSQSGSTQDAALEAPPPAGTPVRWRRSVLITFAGILRLPYVGCEKNWICTIKKIQN